MEKRCLSLSVCRDLWKRAKGSRGKKLHHLTLGLEKCYRRWVQQGRRRFIGFMGKLSHWKGDWVGDMCDRPMGRWGLITERNCASAINVTATWHFKEVVIHVAQDFNKPCLVSGAWKLLSGNSFLYQLHGGQKSTHCKHFASFLMSFTVFETNS